MADSMSYTSNQYLPPHPQYYSPPHINTNHGHVHVVSPPPRQETQQRKRPKYTRSKTGCMTCRVKKIKCDETKPNCMRCTHGQRDCTWPEGAPARKKPIVRKDSMDGRPSTAGSSGVSEASTPPTREPSPPRRNTGDLNPLPPMSRRPNDSYLQLHPMPSEPDSGRRHLTSGDRSSSYTHHNSNSDILTLIPEPSSYPSRYDHSYSNSTHSSHSSRHALPAYRSMGHQTMSQWNHSPDSLDSYYPVPERTLIGHASPSDAHNRYQ